MKHDIVVAGFWKASSSVLFPAVKSLPRVRHFRYGFRVVAPDLAASLCCPMTHLGVRAGDLSELTALNAAIAAGSVVNGRGEKAGKPLEDLLIREDGAAWFPVSGGIPLMIREEMLQRVR